MNAPSSKKMTRLILLNSNLSFPTNNKAEDITLYFDRDDVNNLSVLNSNCNQEKETKFSKINSPLPEVHFSRSQTTKEETNSGLSKLRAKIGSKKSKPVSKEEKDTLSLFKKYIPKSNASITATAPTTILPKKEDKSFHDLHTTEAHIDPVQIDQDIISKRLSLLQSQMEEVKWMKLRLESKQYTKVCKEVVRSEFKDNKIGRMDIVESDEVLLIVLKNSPFGLQYYKPCSQWSEVRTKKILVCEMV